MEKKNMAAEDRIRKKGMKMGMRRCGWIKRWTAWCIMAVLVISMFSGCQKDSGGIGSEDIVQGQEETGKENGAGSQTENQDQAGDGIQAMGRYRETELALPEEVKTQSAIWFGEGKEGDLELYTVTYQASGGVDEAFCYRYRDGEWMRDESWMGSRLFKERGLNLCLAVYGQDGAYYFGGTDESYGFHLLKMKEDGTAEELLQEVFLPKDGQEYGLVPPKIEVLENGDLLVYSYSESYLYTPDGTQKFVFAKDFSGDTGDCRGFCAGEEFVTIQDKALVRYSLQDGKILDTVAFDKAEGSETNIKLFGDGSGGVYAAGEAGLAHLGQGGTLWELFIDGSLNHMGMRSLHLKFFVAGKEQDFYGVFTNQNAKGISMFYYVYDPAMESNPPSTLTVYSLEDHSTVRQAASQFQSDHPEVRVEFRTAVEKGETVSEEMIQSLNTELLSGKGADVLILDGLSAKAYIEKGVLMDISDFIGEMEDSGVLMENIFDGFRQEDGSIYQVPSRMAIILLMGENEAVKAYGQVRTMAEYAGENPLIAADNYENLLRKVASIQYKELFIEENIMDRDGLVQYLETVKKLGEASGSKTVFSEREMEEKWASNHVYTNGISGSSMNYDMGVCDSATERLDGYGDLCIPAQVRKQNPGTMMEAVHGLYLPLSMAGINQSSQNVEMAKEFIRCLLSYEVQKEELYDGFPVNKDALKALTEKEFPGYSVGAGGSYHSYSTGEENTYTIFAEYPDDKERSEIAGMLSQVRTPVLLDETVMKMIVEGSVAYFEGRESANQAADGILRMLSIYLAE